MKEIKLIDNVYGYIKGGYDGDLYSLSGISNTIQATCSHSMPRVLDIKRLGNHIGSMPEIIEVTVNDNNRHRKKECCDKN